MHIENFRIALFSGNYNYVRDGANQALNRLVGYLLRQGALVRVYSPTTDTPAFEPAGELVSLPSFAIPGRGEYRVATGLNGRIRADLEEFRPNIMHLSSPDPGGHGALKWAIERHIPVLASVHTRFETYPRYYGLGFTEPILEGILRRYYQRCNALVAPTESMAQTLREQRMHNDVSIWSRGVDRSIFHPDKRDLSWRQGLGIADDTPVIGFLGRLVMEKGLGAFADTIDVLKKRQIDHAVVVVGDGPARGWFEERMPDAKFVGFQKGPDLGRAVASLDVFFNPSITETFGNVTLEAMASGLPVVAVHATGSESLVSHDVTGKLAQPDDAEALADALSAYCTDIDLRTAHGNAGEERAGHYDWDRINQSVADTYLRLCSQTSSAPNA